MKRSTPVVLNVATLAVLALVVMIQHRVQSRLSAENEGLRKQNAELAAAVLDR